MPEKDLLEGETTETRSSDVYITGQIESSRADYHGLNGQVVEVLPPIAVVDDGLTSTARDGAVRDYTSPKDSIVQIVEVKTQLVIAKKTGDKKAFEEIKRAA